MHLQRPHVNIWILGIVAAAASSAWTSGHEGAPARQLVSSIAAKSTPCPKPGDPIGIVSVAVSDNPMTTGETVSGTVLATCNVAAVTAQVGTYRIGIPKVGVGVFKTTVRVPFILMPGRFTVVVTAIRTDGATVQTDLPIEVRW